MKNTIIEIPIKELVIDESLSGRTKKEIAANAKDLAPKLAAFGRWDVTQPGAVFYRDGKPHLARGFTRVAACDGISKVGFFIELPDDVTSLRTEAIRSNAGKPISASEQGRIYVAMRDGNAETAKKGDTVLAPMKIKDISDAIGYSVQWVTACIGIFEETPDIAELIETEQVGSGAVTRARQIAKKDNEPDDAGRFKLLKAAVKHAAAEGRAKATEDDVNTVRHELFPIKSDAPKRGKPAKKKKADGAPSQENAQGEASMGGTQASGESQEMFAGNSAPDKKTVKKATEIAIEVYQQCNETATGVDAVNFITALNLAGVQLTLSAL